MFKIWKKGVKKGKYLKLVRSFGETCLAVVNEKGGVICGGFLLEINDKRVVKCLDVSPETGLKLREGYLSIGKE